MKKHVKLEKLGHKVSEDVYSNIVDILNQEGVDYKDCEVIRKSTEYCEEIEKETKVKLEPSSRTAIKYVSTRAVDHGGDIVIPKGVDFSLFKKTGMPVFYSHNYSIPQIGRADKISSDEWGVKALVRYADTGEGTLANILWKLTQQDMNKQSSVGIIPLKVLNASDPLFAGRIKELKAVWPELKRTAKSARRIIEKCILFEFSDVGLGMNSDTDVLAVAKKFKEEGASEVLLKQLGLVKEEKSEENMVSDSDSNPEDDKQDVRDDKQDSITIDIDGKSYSSNYDKDSITIDGGIITSYASSSLKDIPTESPESPESPESDIATVPTVKRRVNLVKEPRTVKLVAPPVVDLKEIRENAQAQVRKKMGKVV